MIDSQSLENNLCSTFCSSITINPVACGFAVSTVFSDKAGDRLGFFLIEDEDGYHIEDSGDYLSQLVASGIDIESGVRNALLNDILQNGKAFWDVDTFEIKTDSFSESEISSRMTDFLSSLIRVRDLELITRDVVRSTFKEDAIAAIEERFKNVANFQKDKAINKKFSEFPSDLNIIPKSKGKPAAVFFATNSNKLDEAVMLKQEATIADKDNDFSVIAMIETSDMKGISKRKFQRAQNRSIVMPIFRSDEDAAIELIARNTKLAA